MTAPAEPQALLLKLLDPAIRANPYPVYREILDGGPMQIPESTLHVLSSFADCDEVLRHPDSCSDRLKSTAAQQAIAAGEQPRPFGTPGFLFLDPPDHTRLRRLVSKAFSPKVVKALEPDITGFVDDLLDKVDETGQFDVIEGLAHPLPVAVICRLLGVPIEDEPQFSSASTLLAQGLDPFVTFSGETQGLEARMQAGLWLRGYLRELLERRRSQPADDLMSALISVEESGDQLTEEEIVATCNLLLIAGHETTVNLIANAILAMLRNREHWTALSADPSRASAIIEETLRYDPPVQLASRVAGADMEIGSISSSEGRHHDGVAGRRTSRSSGHRTSRRIRPDPQLDSPPGVRARPAFLPRRPAGADGGRGGVVRGDEALPGCPPGRRTDLQAARHAAGHGPSRRRRLSTGEVAPP